MAGKRKAVDTKVGMAPVGRTGVVILTAVYLTITIILIYSGMAFWPPVQQPCTAAQPCVVVSTGATASASPAASAAPANTTPDVTQVATIPGEVHVQWFFLNDITLDRERSLLVVVAIGGALGAMAHVLRSFYNYVGERHLLYSWVPSYFIIPMVGALFAIFAYVFLRAGLITGTGTTDGSPFGFTAVAILVGLYTNQAAGKFKQVFETVFTKPESGSEPIDSSTAPSITAIAPTSGSVGDLVVITGAHLDAATEVAFGGGVTAKATWDPTTSQLSTHVPAGAESGPLTVSPDDGGPASTQAFEVLSTFSIDSFVPTHAPVGTKVSVRGTGLDDTVDEVVFGGGAEAVVLTFDEGTGTVEVLVPTGAINGSLSIGLGSRTAVSADTFTVDPAPPAPDGTPGVGGEPDPDQPPDDEPPDDDDDVGTVIGAPDDTPAELPTITGFEPPSGAVGTTVVVSGTGLARTEEVVFGGDVAASASNVTATAVTVDVPDDAEEGPLEVEVDGHVVRSAASFKVTNHA
jgi:IPT/TIG domain